MVRREKETGRQREGQLHRKGILKKKGVIVRHGVRQAERERGSHSNREGNKQVLRYKCKKHRECGGKENK